MNKYPSIETYYVRNKETMKLDTSKVRDDTWLAIDRWVLTEKIDGTNIRVIVNSAGLQVKGRTDNAQLPGGLVDIIHELFKGYPLPPEDEVFTFYGEGYGPGITGSEKMNYRPTGKFFRCFDVMHSVGEEYEYWMDPYEAYGMCMKYDIPIAPMISVIHNDNIPTTAQEMSDIIEQSLVTNEDYQGQEIPKQRAEGIVARPIVNLYDRHGQRIIWKLTYRDLI